MLRDDFSALDCAVEQKLISANPTKGCILPKLKRKEWICFHGLRHTFSVLALQNGVDVKTLSAILGHYSEGGRVDFYEI